MPRGVGTRRYGLLGQLAQLSASELSHGKSKGMEQMPSTYTAAERSARAYSKASPRSMDP